MTFIVTFIALMLERFFDWSHLRRWQWYFNFSNKIQARFAKNSPYFILGLILLPILLLVGAIQLILVGMLYGFIELLFQILLLIYCLGPQNLWADAFAAMNAAANGNHELASEKLKAAFGLNSSRKKSTVQKQMTEIIFVEANRRVFATLFWYVLIGPVGAVLYRAVTLSASGLTFHLPTTPLAKSARKVECILDFIPVRLFTFLFALGGHFVQVLAVWHRHLFHGLHDNEGMLILCGVAALGYDRTHPVPDDGTGPKNAISLIDRVLIISLVIIAVIVLLT